MSTTTTDIDYTPTCHIGADRYFVGLDGDTITITNSLERVICTIPDTGRKTLEEIIALALSDVGKRIRENSIDTAMEVMIESLNNLPSQPR